MDLFRRIFGKTSEELADETQSSPKEKVPFSEAKTSPDLTKTATATELAKQEAEKVEAKTDEKMSSTETNQDEVTSSDAPSDPFDSNDPATRPVGPPPPPPGRFSADGVTQPLTSDRLAATRTEHITFGVSSDVGMVRNNNQDAALTFLLSSRSVDDLPDFGLFVVADGMGGHHDGEKASAITTRVLSSSITKDIYLAMLTDEGREVERLPIAEALIQAVQRANKEVLRHVPEGGTTVTAAAVIGDLAHIVHVGDSRAYLITKDNIDQVTRDHSLVQRLIELDQLTPEEAEVHPQKNVLYRALGQNETIEVDTSSRRMSVDSRLLICSDGLWGQVEEAELQEVTMNNVDPQQACDKLVALANTRGGVDNITAIILKLS